MSRNIKTVRIYIPNENVLERIKTTPALKNLSRLDLKVGENIERVNHYQFKNRTMMFKLVNCTVEEIQE